MKTQTDQNDTTTLLREQAERLEKQARRNFEHQTRLWVTEWVSSQFTINSLIKPLKRN